MDLKRVSKDQKGRKRTKTRSDQEKATQLKRPKEGTKKPPQRMVKKGSK